MFFTGLFSTHIPYIILVAVYSISFGIYSVYYINNKTHNKNNKKKPEKEIKYFQNQQITEGGFHFQDYASLKKVDQDSGISNPPYLCFKPCFELKKQVSIPLFMIFRRDTDFNLFSRPPPYNN